MAKICLEVHSVTLRAKYLRKRKVQRNYTTFAWLKMFNLKRLNLMQLNKIKVNMNLNTQIQSLHLLFSLYFIKKKHFRNYEKWFLFSLKSSFHS